jgi:hypothetical protein
LPVFPDTRDYTIVDSPIVVEEDRVELWLQVTAREHDFADDEWSYGQIRLFVPNASSVHASMTEAWIDEPLQGWDQQDPRPAQAPQVENFPDGSGIVVTTGD